MARSDDGAGRFRVMILADTDDVPWPSRRFLRQGVQARGWILLEEVSLGDFVLSGDGHVDEQCVHQDHDQQAHEDPDRPHELVELTNRLSQSQLQS